MRHIDLKLSQQLLISMFKCSEDFECQFLLQIQAILVPESVTSLFAINELFGIWNGEIDPAFLVGPRSAISQDLRFTTATLTPQENTRVVSLKSVEGGPSNVLRSPVVVAKLVVTLHI